MRRGYDIGWPALGFPPIKERIAHADLDAQAVARDAQRRAAEAADAEAARVRAEKLKAAEDERQMLKVARGDVLSALVIAAELTPAMRTLAKVIDAACQAPEGELPKIATANAMALLVRHALIVQRAIGATEAIVQLSRLDRGETTANVGLRPGGDISLEDAIAELEGLGTVVASARSGNGSAHSPPKKMPPRVAPALPPGTRDPH